MALVAVISDMHALHWTRPPWSGLNEQLVKQSLAIEKPKLLIDAGDYERRELHDWCHDNGIEVVSVPGNHDYYGSEWSDVEKRRSLPANIDGESCPHVYRFEGLPPIIAATLWTDFKKDDPLTHLIVRDGLVDSRHIKHYDTRKVFEAHRLDRQFIEFAMQEHSGAIIVTHHGPSYKSVHERYQHDALSWGFVSDMDDVVERSRAKLWVHGHVHTPFDYVIGETRVVCNPCGYPRENPGFYEPLYIEI